jgi:hypothetical protein
LGPPADAVKRREVRDVVERDTRYVSSTPFQMRLQNRSDGGQWPQNVETAALVRNGQEQDTIGFQ